MSDKDLIERLKMEAQIHAQEARTANATIAEIYQIVTGKTGEPGNWNGAEPVRKCIEELRADAARYQWLSRFYAPAGGRDEDEWDEMDTAVLIGGRVLDDAIDAKLSKAGGQPSCLREGEAAKVEIDEDFRPANFPEGAGMWREK